ncbi:uncharacterized protein VTP21DRAFT_10588 [Calcarisporiella thermophila]|uniref:uncharacterized protein n=1 Tax=Calcarisporiella thermophila TaxID=911321 RepID=UPI00374275FB
MCSSIGVLYKTSEAIAMLDMLISFAHVHMQHIYVRPTFTDTLLVKQGRHPILEAFFREPVVPNDIFANSASNFQIITGPNMSGKSTYLRQIALICIMSQIGSLVPAEYASFRIINQLFSRVGSDDDIETNSSSFAVEMRETAYIMHNVTEESLVIIDELGRGTSTNDGIAIACAICDELLKKKPLVFCVTHFQEMISLLSSHPNVLNLNMQSTVGAPDSRHILQHSYTVREGPNLAADYGIKLCKIAGFPEEILTRAREISQEVDLILRPS